VESIRVNWGQEGSKVMQVGLSGRLGDEGLIWKIIGKFWFEVGRDGKRWED
jgi:hypothetical protein